MIVTSSSDSKLELAKKLGAKHAINYNTTPDWDKEVLKLVSISGTKLTMHHPILTCVCLLSLDWW